MLFRGPFKEEDSLERVGAEAEKRGYHWFAAYCAIQAQGLRKQALQEIRAFVQEARGWAFERRKEFCVWHQLSGHNRWMPSPYPLLNELIEPTLAEWREAEPDNIEALRWSKDYDVLRSAIERFPGNVIAVERFAALLLSGIEYATHELPLGYCGLDPKRDEAELTFLLEAIERCAQPVRGLYKDLAQRERSVIRAYISYKAQQCDQSFETWARAAGLPYRS